MANTIFITGGSGFIGRNLINKISLIENCKVYALVRNKMEQFDTKVETIVGDILSSESYASIIKKCDVIFHCAAHISFRKKDFQKAYKVNVEGTRYILEAAYQAGVEKIVHLSACAVLGFTSDKNRILKETEDPEIKEDNIYAFTKKLAEKEIQKYVQKGLDVSIANIATVYGAGDKKLNSGSIIKSIYEGKMKVSPPGGTSFVSVDDLTDGLILLSEKGRPGERYIFHSENMAYKTLVCKIARTIGSKEPICTLPKFSYFPALVAVKGLEYFSAFSKDKVKLITPQILKETFEYKYFSSEKARNELGWKPVQSFEEAVEKAFSYYKANHLL